MKDGKKTEEKFQETINSKDDLRMKRNEKKMGMRKRRG